MRSKEIIASIAVVGAVAAFALFNVNSMPSGQSFLQQGDYDVSFNHFIAKYGKRYGTKEEYLYRLKIFIQNYHIVMNHNFMSANEMGFDMELNHFADLTDQEFKMRLGLRPIQSQQIDTQSEQIPVSGSKDNDWRVKGVVNTIENQGSCGSCWAFSAVGAIESAWAIKYGGLYKLSEQ
jgi:hypothetical protein